MKKIIITSLFLIFIWLSGCSSTPPYNPPNPGNPQATLKITNRCDFTIYLQIDDKDAGSIMPDRSVSHKVTPGPHKIELTGNDDDIWSEDNYPVYFEANHTFEEGENYPLNIKFGINF